MKVKCVLILFPLLFHALCLIGGEKDISPVAGVWQCVLGDDGKSPMNRVKMLMEFTREGRLFFGEGFIFSTQQNGNMTIKQIH